MNLYLAKKKGNDMAHLENILASQLSIILKHDSEERPNGNYINLGMKKSTPIEPT